MFDLHVNKGITMKFIAAYLIIHNEWWTCDQNYANIVLIYLIPTYLALATINYKNTFASSSENPVFDNCCIHTRFTTKSNIWLYIITNIIIFYMSLCLFLNQNSLLKIFDDLIINYVRMSTVVYFDACHFVLRNFVLIKNSWHAVFSLASYSILQVELD
jgi:hypothetical protein